MYNTLANILTYHLVKEAGLQTHCSVQFHLCGDEREDVVMVNDFPYNVCAPLDL